MSYVPIKGAVPPGTPRRAPIERDAPFPELSFVCLSKSPVNEPPPGSPTGPLWRQKAIFRAFLYISLRAPVKGLPSKFPLPPP